MILFYINNIKIYTYINIYMYINFFAITKLPWEALPTCENLT